MDLENLLPPEDVDFEPYFSTAIPLDWPGRPKGKRRDIAVQRELLRYFHRGKPEITAFHMLLISYLRRNSPHTKQARNLFFRLWREYPEELLATINLREKISALQTIADHSPNHVQRLTSKLALIYIYLIRGYESERVSERRDPKEVSFSLLNKEPRLNIGELTGVIFTGDESLELINLLLAEEVLTDPLTGPLILHVLKAVQDGDSLFSRIDRARIRDDIDSENASFWGFGFRPDE